MKDRSSKNAMVALAAAWAATRLAFPPSGHNSHTLMYPIVDAAGSYNTLEPFHPLYLPIVACARRLWSLLNAPTPALPLLQAVSFAAAVGNIFLLHRIVKRATGSSEVGLGAAMILAASANLWSWSLMTTSYTLATLCLLAATDRLIAREELVGRDIGWIGLWIGLAAGFDTAAGVAILPAAWEIHRRRASGENSGRLWTTYVAFCLAPTLSGLAFLAWRLGISGHSLPSSPAAFVHSLPSDIIPLWKSFDLTGQIRGWRASTAPLDLPLWAATGVVIWSVKFADSWPQRSLWRFGASLWALICLFFFINDPHNRFIYASTLLLPALFAIAARKTRRPLLLCACAAACLALWHAFDPPDYAPKGTPGFAESRFLADRIGRDDALVALSDPDWVFSYAWNGRSRVLKIARPRDERAHFGEELIHTLPELEGKLDQIVCSGHKALFAADSLFRSTLLDAETLDAEAERIFRALQRRYSVGDALISADGQRYFPLRCAHKAPSPRVE